MPIPNARDSPPPPLPPPRHINEPDNGQDLGWQWGGPLNGASYSRTSSVKPGSSLLGNSHVKMERPGEGGENAGFDSGRGSTTSMATHSESDMAGEAMDLSDEDRARRPSLANYRLQSENQLGQRSLQTSSHAYDKQLLSKIGGPNTPGRAAVSAYLSTSAQEGSPNSQHAVNQTNGQLKPLSMPERRYSALDSPSTRWPSVPSSGAVSPGFGFRSPNIDPSLCDSAFVRRHGSISAASALEEPSSGLSRTQRPNDDQGVFIDQDFALDENGMRDLNLEERSPAGSEEYQLGSKGGLKRTASSPPTEASRGDRPSVGDGNDLYYRRSSQMVGNRNSPVQRFHDKHGSLSSAASSYRTGSYASSWGLSVASTATSYTGEHVSPGTSSPSVETDVETGGPYARNKSPTNPSPRASVSKPLHKRVNSGNVPPHSRKPSTGSAVYSRQNSVSQLQGLYICECCPKKPKKFDSHEELRAHESEKQYTCQYCPNRFKNKNEAERHQNSLHLRRHSWSCAALAGIQAAFHPSTVHPTTADVCGYCGEEFASPANWDLRAEHLNHVHKFGECNQAKKFFRADHFRQHLKHSHAGTSGKWTNMLENACMKDEPPTPKDRVESVTSLDGVSPGGVTPLGKPDIINEVHEES